MLSDACGSLCGHSGFFRRALEWTHNNFTIYCGRVMVYCHWCIGLECAILFWGGLYSRVGFSTTYLCSSYPGPLELQQVKYKSSHLHFRKEY